MSPQYLPSSTKLTIFEKSSPHPTIRVDISIDVFMRPSIMFHNRFHIFIKNDNFCVYLYNKDEVSYKRPLIINLDLFPPSPLPRELYFDWIIINQFAVDTTVFRLVLNFSRPVSSW